jgi:hypothetical protein
MSDMSSSGTGDAGSNQERMVLIREGMDVEDTAGERIGKVTDIRMADPYATAGDNQGSVAQPVGGFAVAMGSDGEPNVASWLSGQLRRSGYIKIDDKRHFRRDHHYYASADDIVSVEADTVRLAKARDELITPLPTD